MNVTITQTPAFMPEEKKIQQSLKVQPAAADKTHAAAKKVAREFEAMFVGMMVKSMRETVGKDPLTGGGHGEEVYRSLLDQEYARVITENGGLGLAAVMEKLIVGRNGTSGQEKSGKGPVAADSGLKRGSDEN